MICAECEYFVCEAPDLGDAGLGYCDVLNNPNYGLHATGSKECKMPEKREKRERAKLK